MTREQIEQLPAGRGLDALIAEKVMGTDTALIYEVDWVRGGDGEIMVVDRSTLNPESTVPAYSTDIAAAWHVVEKIRGEKDQVRVFIDSQPNGDWSCHLEPRNAIATYAAEEDTLPLAICRAALLTTLT